MKKFILFTALVVMTCSMARAQFPNRKNNSVQQYKPEQTVQPTYLKNLHRASQLPVVMQKQSIPGGTTPVIIPVHTNKQYLDSMTTTIFDQTANEWVKEYRKNYTYDQTGKISGYIIERWKTPKQKLEPESRTNYTYDNFGHLLVKIKCFWDPLINEWVGELREELSYTGSGEIAVHIYYLWDCTINAWVQSIKNEFLYNPDGSVACYTYFLWNPVQNQWVGDFKEEFTYDAGGLLAQYLCCSWDYVASQWVHSWRSEYIYDVSGNLESLTYAAWNPDSLQWINEFRYDYAWSGGLLAEEIYCEWCCNTQLWGQVVKHTFSYDVSGKPLLITCYNNKYNSWMNMWKEEYHYNSYGHQRYYNYYEWDSAGNQWSWLLKTESLKDVQGNLLHMESWFWDSNTKAWCGDFAQENTFNYAWNVSTMVFPDWIMNETVEFHNMLTSSRNWYWDFNQKAWIESSRVDLYFSTDQSTGIETAEADNLVRIYPNPASDYMYVDIKTFGAPILVEIYNVQGVLVLQQLLPDDHRIDVGHLNKGTYICILNHDKAIRKSKLSIL